MQIHEITIPRRKPRKRIGRGGRRGTYSGRGMKGQKARSGGNVNPLFEGGRSSLIDRLKKVRGFKSLRPKKVTIHLADLEKFCADGDHVTMELLQKKKLVRKKHVASGAKIVDGGSCTKKLTIGKGVAVTASAAAAIKKAGGTVQK